MHLWILKRGYQLELEETFKGRQGTNFWLNNFELKLNETSNLEVAVVAPSSADRNAAPVGSYTLEDEGGVGEGLDGAGYLVESRDLAIKLTERASWRFQMSITTYLTKYLWNVIGVQTLINAKSFPKWPYTESLYPVSL